MKKSKVLITSTIIIVSVLITSCFKSDPYEWENQKTEQTTEVQTVQTSNQYIGEHKYVNGEDWFLLKLNDGKWFVTYINIVNDDHYTEKSQGYFYESKARKCYDTLDLNN